MKGNQLRGNMFSGWLKDEHSQSQEEESYHPENHPDTSVIAGLKNIEQRCLAGYKGKWMKDEHLDKADSTWRASAPALIQLGMERV